MIDGVISFEPSQEMPWNGEANVDLEMPTLKPEPETLSKVNVPSSLVEVDWTLFPLWSNRLTFTPGIPSSGDSPLPGVPPPGLKSRQTTPVIAPAFVAGTTACFAAEGTSVGGIAVRPSSAVPPAEMDLCNT